MIENDLSLVSIIVLSHPVLLQLKISRDHCSTQSLHQQWCSQIICSDQRNINIGVFYQQSMDLRSLGLAAKTYIRTHKITYNKKTQKKIDFRSVVHCHSRSILALVFIVCFCQPFQRLIDSVIRFTGFAEAIDGREAFNCNTINRQ